MSLKVYCQFIVLFDAYSLSHCVFYNPIFRSAVVSYTSVTRS